MSAKISVFPWPHFQSIFLGVVLGMLVLFLAGCGVVKEEVWLNGGEQWKVNLSLSLNPNERSMLGSDFDQQMEQSAAQARQEGIKFSWGKRDTSDGGVTYTASSEGKGLDNLNKVAFSKGAALSKDSAGNVHLIWNPGSMSGSRGYTLTIHGGRIISSNADERTSNSVTWHEPARQVQVVMAEGGSSITTLLALGMACACLLVALVIAGGVVFVLLRRSKKGVAEGLAS